MEIYKPRKFEIMGSTPFENSGFLLLYPPVRREQMKKIILAVSIIAALVFANTVYSKGYKDGNCSTTPSACAKVKIELIPNVKVEVKGHHQFTDAQKKAWMERKALMNKKPTLTPKKTKTKVDVKVKTKTQTTEVKVEAVVKEKEKNKISPLAKVKGLLKKVRDRIRR